MSCTNCFNGCTEITSDKCVRYTGADIPELGIQNGDTLQLVEQALAQYIISALDGTGIKPAIDPSIICSTVSVNLPTCGEFTITDLITALIKSTCDLQESIDATVVDIADINAELGVLNAPYSVPDCIEGTVDNESTHSVLQALLVNFCALVISIPNTYVSLSGPGGINEIINQELEDIGLTGPNTKQYTKMVPYVAYPWFPTTAILANFSSTGAGIAGSEYENIYFCNGANPGVPDLRGRVLAGVTTGMLGNSLPADVNPLINTLNPNYTQGVSFGANYITLDTPQLPPHNHTATTVVRIEDPGHLHNSVDHGFQFNRVNCDGECDSFPENTAPSTLPTTSNPTGLKGTAAGSGQNVFVDVTVNNTGNNLPHSNTQPTIGCFYIMYIPA